MSVQARLKRYYREVLHDPDVQITNMRAISDGWETEVYSFLEGYNGLFRNRILRMYPGMDAAEKSVREFQGMRQLKTLGYPVPKVIEYNVDSLWLGKPFITMERIKGHPFGLAMRFYDRNQELTTRFCQLIVDLHRLDTQSFTFLEAGEPSDFLPRKLAFAQALIIDQLHQFWALPILDWLRVHMGEIQTSHLVVMHTDFHPWNILLTPNDDAVVIDWSGLELGDYRYDLAWTMLLFDTTLWSGNGELIRAEYERLAGRPVEQIEYFEVIATLRRLLGLAVALGAGAESLGMRLEAAQIMGTQGDHFRHVYRLLQHYTGLRLPEIERLLDTLKGST